MTQSQSIATSHEERDGRQASFRRVKRLRSLDEVVLQVRDAVEAKELRPGDRLPSERVLCDAFGVSRPTLREALRTLEALGVIQIRRGSTGGIFVARPTAALVSSALESLLRFGGSSPADLTEVRLAIESQNARLAADRALEEHLEELDELVLRLKQLCSDPAGSWADIVDVDLQFHEAVARASQNPVSVAVMYAASGALRPFVIGVGDRITDARRASVARDHKRVADAIRSRDAKRAAKLMSDHIERWGRIEAER